MSNSGTYEKDTPVGNIDSDHHDHDDHDEDPDFHSDILSDETELEEKKEKMSIADLYVPSHITKHRILTRGRSPKQLQFLTEWHPGWTTDKSLAKSVIRKHPKEDNLYYVTYKASWEPYTEYYDTITPKMIRDYKKDYDVTSFGSDFDNLVEKLSSKERRSLKANDIYPNYEFEYTEVLDSVNEEDGSLMNPPTRKKRGRPKKRQFSPATTSSS